MCEIYNVCHTLSKGNEFHWQLNNGVYSVRRTIDGPAMHTFSTDLYAISHELILRQPHGTPLGARGDGEAPADSLGAALQLHGKTRPLASYLAAIAVAEGFFQYEDLGAGPGHGIRLYPVFDEPIREQHQAGEDTTTDASKFSDTHAAAKTAADALRDLAARVKASQPPEYKAYELNLSELTANEPPTIVTDIQNWEGSTGTNRYIYRFFVENSSIASELYTCLIDSKLRADNDRKYSRVNTTSSDSLCLYVGSSKSVTQRMKQHLGYAHPAVYSLHMRSWSNLPDASVRLEILKYPGDVGQDVLQAIEDSLWQSSMPLFGKQGAR